MKQGSVSSAPNFQPCQIVYLEHEHARLYAEVIQIVATRQVCWVRPLMLLVFSADADPLEASPDQLSLYNLHQSSDLVWPVSLFRPALDTEVVPLLAQLNTPQTQLNDEPAARQQFSWFIHRVWQAHQNEF